MLVSPIMGGHIFCKDMLVIVVLQVFMLFFYSTKVVKYGLYSACHILNIEVWKNTNYQVFTFKNLRAFVMKRGRGLRSSLFLRWR